MFFRHTLVKCILGNFNSISFIGLHFTKRIIIKVLDKFLIDSTDEKIQFWKLMGEDFVITSCMFHYELWLTFNGVGEFYKWFDITGCMFDFKRLGNNLAERVHNRSHTFTLRNIDTYCVHKFVIPRLLQWISISFTHCLFNLLWCCTNVPEVVQSV